MANRPKAKHFTDQMNTKTLLRRTQDAVSDFSRKAAAALLVVACSIASIIFLLAIAFPPYVETSAAYAIAAALWLGLAITLVRRTPMTWKPIFKRAIGAALVGVAVLVLTPWHMDKVEQARTPEQKAARLAEQTVSQPYFEWGTLAKEMPQPDPPPLSQRDRCLVLGKAYYKEIGSYPQLSTGEDAEQKIATFCQHNPETFRP